MRKGYARGSEGQSAELGKGKRVREKGGVMGPNLDCVALQDTAGEAN